MSTITTRAGKGSPLTNTEMDTNLTNLNTDKVDGAASSTDNAITRFDSTTGKVIQNSLVTVADDGAITAPSVGSVIPFYFANQAAFPSATTYHGALAHSHSDGKVYFAHSSSWNALANASELPTLGTGVATFLATPSSANLASALTDESGSSTVAFTTSPTFVTPALGVASATSVNKVAITAPATGSTLTIADGKTLTASNTLTFTGTDASSVAFGTGGTVAYLGANTFTAAQEWASGTAIASASTINLDTATGNRVHITGTTAITAVTLTRGPRTVIFDGILTLTHHATTNNLPGAANITTAAGDRAIYESDGTTVYCVNYTKVSGVATVVGSSVPTVIRSARTANTILDVADQGTLIDITSGTFSQTFTAAATLGSGWFCYLRNSGTGDITLDPNSSELIDGLTTYIMYPGEARLVQCTGTALTTIVLSPFYRVFTASGTFTKPAGYLALNVEGYGAGGGGGGGGKNIMSSQTGGGGGGGGAYKQKVFSASLISATETITIGAGGTGGAAVTVDSTGATSGTDGGNSSFGALLIAYGGKSNSGIYGGSGGGSLDNGYPRDGEQSLSGASYNNRGFGGADAFGTGGGAASGFGGGSGAGSANGAIGGAGGASAYGGGGGGAGGASNYSNMDGGAGGGQSSTASGAGGGGAGGIASTSTVPPAQTLLGKGGGGGYSSYATYVASAGAAGGIAGGGGGGGSALDGGYNSGAGGAGGRGEIRIAGVA